MSQRTLLNVHKLIPVRMLIEIGTSSDFIEFISPFNYFNSMNVKVFILMGLLTMAFAAAPAKSANNPTLKTMNQEIEPEYLLTSFRINVLYATYFSGEVGSGAIGWTPGVRFNRNWETRLLIGASLLKDANRDNPTYFLAPEIQILTDFRFFWNLILEVGGGLQKWMTLDGTTNPLLTLNLHYSFNRLLGPIDTVFIGYSALWNINQQDQVRIGLQISF